MFESERLFGVYFWCRFYAHINFVNFCLLSLLLLSFSYIKTCCNLASCKNEGYFFWTFRILEMSESVEDVNDHKWHHKTGIRISDIWADLQNSHTFSKSNSNKLVFGSLFFGLETRVENPRRTHIAEHMEPLVHVYKLHHKWGHTSVLFEMF